MNSRIKNLTSRPLTIMLGGRTSVTLDAYETSGPMKSELCVSAHLNECKKVGSCEVINDVNMAEAEVSPEQVVAVATEELMEIPLAVSVGDKPLGGSKKGKEAK